MTRFIQHPATNLDLTTMMSLRLATMRSLRTTGVRSFFSGEEAARPMTRFFQHPFDKSKMEEVTEWVKESDLPNLLRSQPGVKDVEISFCPGEGWLSSRIIFDDLPDMVNFLEGDAVQEIRTTVAAAPHFDSNRQSHEFKGFYLSDV